MHQAVALPPPPAARRLVGEASGGVSARRWGKQRAVALLKEATDPRLSLHGFQQPCTAAPRRTGCGAAKASRRAFLLALGRVGAGAATALGSLDDIHDVASLSCSILGSFDAADLPTGAADLATTSAPRSPRRFNRRGQRAPLDTPHVNSSTLQALDDPLAEALAPLLAQAARQHTSAPFAKAAPARQPAVAAPSAPQPQPALASQPCTLLYGGADLAAMAPVADCPAALQPEACEDVLRAQAAVWVAAVQQQLRSRLLRFDLAPQVALV